jgi:glycosyltransferase involved in cell wall biosynthesis
MQRYEALYVIGLRASLLLRLAKPCLRGARLVQGVRWNPNSESCLDRAFRLAERVLGRLIDLYICNSKAAAQTIDHELHIPPRRVRVIYNGLAQIPATLPSFSERSLQVLTIANLSPRKGYLEYIEQVVAPLCKRLPEARFVIVGRDEMAGAVQRKIANLELAEVVTCVGFQQDVSGYFGTACVFALPSLWNEGCPTSILEAMAHGLPTVAFALDGIPELVEHDVDGILVPLKDYERMGKAIEQLLQDPARAMCMGMRGRDKVMTRFKVEHSAAAHVRAFDELLLDPNK